MDREKQRSNIYKILDYTWIAVAVIVFVFSIKYLTDGTLEMRVAEWGLWAPLGIALLKISTLVVAPLGGLPLYIISGALFGTYKGFLICFISDIVGSAICFLLSRKYGSKVLGFFVGEDNRDKVLKVVGLIGTPKLFLKARVALFNGPEFVAYAAGLSSINFWIFLIIQSAIFIPIDFILVLFGSQIVNWSSRYSWAVFAVPSLIAVAGLWFLYKDYKEVSAA